MVGQRRVTTDWGMGGGGRMQCGPPTVVDGAAVACGFCTPGMVMSACELSGKLPNPTDEQIREALDGNICRCTGYHNIVKAVKSGLSNMQKPKAA